jgi:hypothetical protein
VYSIMELFQTHPKKKSTTNPDIRIMQFSKNVFIAPYLGFLRQFGTYSARSPRCPRSLSEEHSEGHVDGALIHKESCDSR